jgi:glycogen(starch) synthase
MKVLIYTEYFFPIPGGVQTVVLELARGLSAWQPGRPGAQRIEVTVVTRTRERTAGDDALPFRLVRQPTLRELLRLLRRTDIVHLAGPVMLPLALGLALLKPVVIEHHGFQVACPNGLLLYEPTQTPCPGHFMAGHYGKCLECNQKSAGLRKSLSWLMLTHVRRWLASHAAANIMPTTWLATILELNRATTIYHGIFGSEAALQNIPSSAAFAYQGRLVTSKGIGVLLQAAGNLSKANYKFQLKIIGDGPEQDSLKRVAANLEGHVEFLGHVADDRMEAAMADVTAVVMPSLGGEVFGLVAAENMLRGKLLIVSDIGALQEVVGDSGLVFRTGDIEDLASRMRQVLETPSLAVSMGSAARARAMKVFNRGSMIKSHVALYEEALLR